MGRRIRLWQRDLDVRSELKRWPLRTSAIAILCGFSSRKKAAERLNHLRMMGLITSAPSFLPAKQGKPENAYSVNRSRLRERTLMHDLIVGDVHAHVAVWLRTSEWSGEFYYTHELPTSGGIIPDATLILRRGEKTGLFFFEIDNGTEPVSSTSAYSLAKKLALYATYFDSSAYQHDVAFAGTFGGFRVCLLTPAGRVRHVQQLIAREQHNFVLIAALDQLSGGLDRLMWTTSENERVDLLGRPGELVQEMVGEIIKPHLPTTNPQKSCSTSSFPSRDKSETLPPHTEQQQ